jgi:hypothetical protein
MNKQIEMKQMIRNGAIGGETELISKLRWNKWLDMVEMAGKLDEQENWNEINDYIW